MGLLAVKQPVPGIQRDTLDLNHIKLLQVFKSWNDENVKNQKPNQMTRSGLAKEFVPQQNQGYYWSCGEPDIYNNGVGNNLLVTHKISSKNMQDHNHPEIRLLPQCQHTMSKCLISLTLTT